MILDNTTTTLILQAVAAPGTAIPCGATFFDQSQARTIEKGAPACPWPNPRKDLNQIAATGTAAITLVAAPASGDRRIISHLWLRNAATGEVTIKVICEDTAETPTQVELRFTLASADMLFYDGGPDGGHWFVLDAYGRAKSSAASSGTPTFLSGQTNGRSIKVAATATPGTLLHTAVNVTGQRDRIYLFATNTDTVTRKLTVEWGGTTDPDDLIVKAFVLPSSSGRYPIVQGEFLGGGVVVRAFASTANVITCGGYYERVTA